MDQMVSPSPFLRPMPFADLQACLLNGKSMDFLPLKVHHSHEKESKKRVAY